MPANKAASDVINPFNCLNLGLGPVDLEAETLHFKNLEQYFRLFKL